MKKTNALLTLLTGLIFSTSAIAAVPTTERVKAEPTKPTSIHLINEAVASSLATIKLDTDYTQQVENNSFAIKKQKLKRNKTMNITSNEIAAD
ncbi:hypothetical protein KO495_11670 [Colwellia sp. D2M02]|uniref:Uncharacterized protein n=1 Tax=Colwellia asteriadis TaxID=517723 RepID=A0ABP3WFL7_9GAMM|nr:hypothetical protein [Colwellia sp. D2M02]MBU2893975.1 hypothetical protein [Colwellia sp. D2M02]